VRTINVPLNLPNILSLYRLFSFPFILIFVFLGHRDLFAFFICFNLFTDFLDGWIARHFNQITEIGEKIDGLADNGTYILAISGILIFKWSNFQPHAVSFFIFLGLFFISRLYFLFKFGKLHGFHAYSGKIGGYIHGSFFMTLFVFGFYEWFYYIMIFSGYIICMENLLIVYFLKECRSNVKGLYWLLRERKMS
jgi:cardiolipin synthase (CMP-forming)